MQNTFKTFLVKLIYKICQSSFISLVKSLDIIKITGSTTKTQSLD